MSKHFQKSCLMLIVMLAFIVVQPVSAISDISIEGIGYWGDTLTVTVTNASDNSYLAIATPSSRMWEGHGCRIETIIHNTKIPAGSPYSYRWKTGEFDELRCPLKEGMVGEYTVSVFVGLADNIETTRKFIMPVKPLPTPTPTEIIVQIPEPTPEPTIDYDAKIADLEAQIMLQATIIQEISEKTPVPTPSQTTVTTTPTPVPTSTINHTATIEALEKQIAEHNARIEEQDNLIDMILKFLGLKK